MWQGRLGQRGYGPTDELLAGFAFVASWLDAPVGFAAAPPPASRYRWLAPPPDGPTDGADPVFACTATGSDT